MPIDSEHIMYDPIHVMDKGQQIFGTNCLRNGLSRCSLLKTILSENSHVTPKDVSFLYRGAQIYYTFDPPQLLLAQSKLTTD